MSKVPRREARPVPPESPGGRPSIFGKDGDPHVAPTVEVPALGEEAPQLEELQREGLEIEARSQWELARKRFFRHRLAMGSLILLVAIFLAGIFAPALTPYEPLDINLEDIGMGPSLTDRHFFGTDQLGRDYFSRVLFAVRTTARVAFLVAFLSTILGTLIGALAGYFGGWIDNVLMRFTDLLLTLPYLVILLTISALVGSGSPTRVAFILALLFWAPLARVVRGTFLSLKEKEFVEAARAVGATDRRIILRHMLPNSMGPIIVNATLTIATAILVEAFLSFLGFGIRPPTPALGSLISEGQGSMLQMWWLVTCPGLTIVTICLCVNFMGDGLRDALDPTQGRVRA